MKTISEINCYSKENILKQTCSSNKFGSIPLHSAARISIENTIRGANVLEDYLAVSWLLLLVRLLALLAVAIKYRMKPKYLV